MDVPREVCQARFWFYSLEHLHQASLRNLLPRHLPVPPRAVPKHPGKACCTAKSQISRFQPAVARWSSDSFCLTHQGIAYQNVTVRTLALPCRQSEICGNRTAAQLTPILWVRPSFMSSSRLVNPLSSLDASKRIGLDDP